MTIIVLMAPSAAATAAGSGLDAWIQEHQVCWEVGPYFEIQDHQKVQLGFSLTLLARPPASCALDPGREECVAIFEQLQEIVQRVVPEAVRVHMEAFDASVHLRPETGWEPEVELNVEILHREGTFEPLDETERRCLAVIQQRLEAMGVQEKSWDPRRAVGGR